MDAKLGFLSSALQVVDETPERNKLSSMRFWNGLINRCCRDGNLNKASGIFEVMPMRNSNSCSSLMNGYSRIGEKEKARLVLGLSQRNVGSWTTMVNGISQNGDHQQSTDMFFRMLDAGSRPNDQVIVSDLSARASIGALETGFSIHNYASNNRFKGRRQIGAELVDMYAKCAKMYCADNMVSESQGIAGQSGLAAHGCSEQALQCSEITRKGEKKQLQNEEINKICSSNGNVTESDASFAREPIAFADKKLLVLDLNGLLVDVGKRSCTKRPYCDDFLKFCFERFHVGVWSSRTKKNVNKVVDFLMGDLKENLIFCWDQSHCTETGFKVIGHWYKPLILKELKKLWNKHEQNLPWEKGTFNESNTLLLDDSPYKALCNPLHTGIFPSSYTREDLNDDSLGPGGDIRVYLEGLVEAGNVQKYVERHPFGQPAITHRNPFWCFYRQVHDTVVTKMKQKEFLKYV
ncbi:hypothetical protein MKW98_028167 [Papaver atlanticum]|uniref:Mitochondrial import inner membrane translocase subunit TIM50 n=1 Tax=Papaver atlanticum TaxID=357466 RepID=A0AAD4SXV4_9MAGN|nr:hypothetical protein MKW98_028167 [Papaver atlanticum]